ncbi:MAG: ABC transporter substrate-binding protein [Clostridia bacterium]|nr:ABC transporter substrate-binding protein [Clostridia bacterium]
MGKGQGYRGLRLASLALALVFLVSAVAGCGQKQEGGGQASNTIKVGINFELTGNAATYGSHCRDGILLAIEEINKSGGVLNKQLEPKVLDNASKQDESTNVATKLATEEKVKALLGPATTGCTLGAAPVATENKIPLITTAATAPSVTVDDNGKVRDFVFRVCFIDPPQAIMGARFAYNDLKVKKAAIYYDTGNDYSKGLYQNFKDEFTKLGGQIVAEEGFSSTDEDFRPTLTKFKQNGAELIYIPAYYNQVGKIVSQARELKIDVPMLGADGWDSPDLVKIAGAQALNHTYFTNHYSSADPSSKVQEFIKAYKAKYGSEPDAFAALGYDAAYLLKAAIEKANSDDPVAIKDALAQIKDFEGVTGKLTFDDKHNPMKEISIIELKDGKQSLVKKVMYTE